MRTATLKIEDIPHYTYDDYVQWEGQWELIQGIPFAMTPAPAVKHQQISTKIVLHLGELLKQCTNCQVIMPLDWQITEDTVVQPDVIVVCGDDIGVLKLETTPVIIFEVLSPSTSKKDRVLKYRLYESAGVKYYCVVDPETSSADVFVLKPDKYTQADGIKDGRIRFDLEPCEIEFDFGKIF
jgi:Uma2 family endonuclease